MSSACGVEVHSVSFVHSVYYSMSLRTVVPVCAIAKCCMYSTTHCYREHAVSIRPLIVAEMWHRGPQTDYLCINVCLMDCVSHFVSMKAKKCLICWLYYWLGIFPLAVDCTVRICMFQLQDPPSRYRLFHCVSFNRRCSSSFVFQVKA